MNAPEDTNPHCDLDEAVRRALWGLGPYAGYERAAWNCAFTHTSADHRFPWLPWCAVGSPGSPTFGRRRTA